MKKIILLLSIFYSSFTFSFQDEMVLRGGFVAATNKAKTNLATSDDFRGYGVATQFGRKFSNYELLLSSEAYFGKVEFLKFKVGNDVLEGTGSIRSVGITPTFKYIINVEPVAGWKLYMSLGPSWVLQSIVLDDFKSSSTPVKNHKLAYDSRGGSFAIGIEEETIFKEMHPVYVQLMVNYYKSHKVSLVDKSDQKEINILSSTEAKQDIQTLSFMISMGMIIF